jgi:hypothetical protein
MFMAVKGMPYSIQMISEHSQTLASGTHITQQPRTEQRYRDSEGRTRTERSVFAPRIFPAVEIPTIIEIHDPVAGYSYVLDTQNHVAHRSRLTVRTPPTGVRRAIPPAATTSTRDGITTTREPLGTQVLEGVNVVGSRTTTVIDTGAQGNDAPITTTMESWFSERLGQAVLTRLSDPRNGESTTRLTNISLSEPDPTLFQIPADYQMVDETAPFQIHYDYSVPKKQ